MADSVRHGSTRLRVLSTRAIERTVSHCVFVRIEDGRKRKKYANDRHTRWVAMGTPRTGPPIGPRATPTHTHVMWPDRYALPIKFTFLRTPIIEYTRTTINVNLSLALSCCPCCSVHLQKMFYLASIIASQSNHDRPLLYVSLFKHRDRSMAQTFNDLRSLIFRFVKLFNLADNLIWIESNRVVKLLLTKRINN